MKLSKGLYLGVIAGGFIVGFVLVFLGMGSAIMGAIAAQNQGSQTGANAAAAGGMGLAMLGFLCMLVALVMYVVLVFKAWSAIQDGQASWSPAAAAIPLVIPILNLVWGFIGVWGWAKDYNKYVTRHNLNVPKMAEGLFLAQPICLLCSIIPFVGVIAGLGHLVLFFLNASKMCDGVNALSSAPMAAGAAAGR